jgi:ABC-type enterochelin transport system permease subunit
MLLAPTAILLELDTALVVLTTFLGGVVAFLALGAGHSHHHAIFLLCHFNPSTEDERYR